MPWVLDIHRDEKLQESMVVMNNIMTIGREECDVNLSDVKVSRLHCSFYMQEDTLTVVDNSSTNGTFVNGRKVQRKDLKNGDEVVVGVTNIIIRKV
jgi:pSer/pThr/pTyr-binding forkhead associated (FHA) protein